MATVLLFQSSYHVEHADELICVPPLEQIPIARLARCGATSRDATTAVTLFQWIDRLCTPSGCLVCHRSQTRRSRRTSCASQSKQWPRRGMLGWAYSQHRWGNRFDRSTAAQVRWRITGGSTVLLSHPWEAEGAGCADSMPIRENSNTFGWYT